MGEAVVKTTVEIKRENGNFSAQVASENGESPTITVWTPGGTSWLSVPNERKWKALKELVDGLLEEMKEACRDGS